MTDRRTIRDFADQIAGHLTTIADEQVSIKAILDTAKDQGIDTKALLKVARNSRWTATRSPSGWKTRTSSIYFARTPICAKRNGIDDQRRAA